MEKGADRAERCGSCEDFERAIEDLTREFLASPFCAAAAAGELDVWHYHSLLLALYHQVRWNAATLALAAGHCDPARDTLRTWLLGYADRESARYRQVERDLIGTGYRGERPATLPMPQATEAYVSFEYFVACTKPLARLALEAYHANLRKIVVLHIEPGLARIRSRSGAIAPLGSVTSAVQVAEVYRTIIDSAPSAHEWSDLVHTTMTAAGLYRGIYDATLSV